jgi:hypothetical protein
MKACKFRNVWLYTISSSTDLLEKFCGAGFCGAVFDIARLCIPISLDSLF